MRALDLSEVPARVEEGPGKTGGRNGELLSCRVDSMICAEYASDCRCAHVCDYGPSSTTDMRLIGYGLCARKLCDRLKRVWPAAEKFNGLATVVARMT